MVVTLMELLLQEKTEVDVEAYLRRRYESQIADIEIIEKEDLDLVRIFFFFFFFCVTILIIFLVLENIRNVLQLYCFPSYAYQASFLVSTIFKWLPDYFLGLPKKWSCLNSGLGDREISTIPLAMLEAPLVFGQS